MSSKPEAVRAPNQRPLQQQQAPANRISEQAREEYRQVNRAEQPIMQSRRARNDGPNLRITYLMNPGVEIVNQSKVIGDGIKRTF